VSGYNEEEVTEGCRKEHDKSLTVCSRKTVQYEEPVSNLAGLALTSSIKESSVRWEFGSEHQAGSSLVRFQMVLLEFFIDIILPAALWPWGLAQIRTEMSTSYISWGVNAAGV
jgi:hypothetical protein